MDWKVFGTTFISILIAEMGDKTQIAALSASAGSNSTRSVWLAVVLALGIAGTIGVFAGKLLGQYIQPNQLKWISGGLFISIGIWTLLK